MTLRTILLTALIALCLLSPIADAHRIGITPGPAPTIEAQTIALGPQLIRFNRRTIGPAPQLAAQMQRLRAALPACEFQVLVGVTSLPSDLPAFSHDLEAEIRSLPLVATWSCGNEIRHRGVSWTGTDAQYLTLLGTFYRTVKRVNPQLRVLVAGEAASEVLANWQPAWVKAVEDRRLTDGWDIHVVGIAQARSALARMQSLTRLPIRITELTGSLGISPDRQAAELPALLAATTSAEAVCYLPLQDDPTLGPWGCNGLLDLRGIPKPAYTVLQSAIATDR